MNNLTTPVKKMMFNTALAQADVGLYADSKQGVLKLAFKKMGIQLPGVKATSVPAPSTGTANKDKYTVTVTCSGVGVGIVTGPGGISATITF